LHVIHDAASPTTATLAAPSEGITPVPFSEQRLADLRAANRVVFVNMTADWCVTRKANERGLPQRWLPRCDGIGQRRLHGRRLTDVDPALTAFLQRYKAVGVLLYVVFPRNGGEGRAAGGPDQRQRARSAGRSRAMKLGATPEAAVGRPPPPGWA
jgi:thiol:disulfide interchange protein DsbD